MCSILLLRNDEQEQNGVAFAPVTFRFQNSSSLWRPPRPRMDLDSGMQVLYGKLLESTFICIKPQVHIVSEPTAISILVQRHFSANSVATRYFEILGFCWLDLALATSAGNALLAKLPISGFQNPNLIVFLSITLHIHHIIQCLFYLFLLVLRLLAGQMLSWLGCRVPQDHVDHGC
jgi:hypothetical protein